MGAIDRKVLLPLALLLTGVLVASLFWLYPVTAGNLALHWRALGSVLSGGLLAAGVRPWFPWLNRRPLLYALLMGIPLLAIGPWYFLAYLPTQAGSGVTGEQLASSLITESTSNGIVEIGFAYPIYTPTLRITNNELFTRDVDIYLRILDGNDEAALFRAVRTDLPDGRLSVEATVRGLLSESPGYLFLPVTVPPRRAVEGRVVFIISNLNDGSTFDEALGRSYPAQFQLRDARSGELLSTVPMTNI